MPQFMLLDMTPPCAPLKEGWLLAFFLLGEAQIILIHSATDSGIYCRYISLRICDCTPGTNGIYDPVVLNGYQCGIDRKLIRQR